MTTIKSFTTFVVIFKIEDYRRSKDLQADSYENSKLAFKFNVEEKKIFINVVTKKVFFNRKFA